jgi:ribosomal protein S12 methylthiotransferase accessory factor
VAALPAARDRFAFLLDPPAPATPVEPTHRPRGDVAADLAALLAAARESGLRVLVVDHTTSELHRLGLTCVKAVLPGTVPMTFGHRHRRMPGSASLKSFRRRHHATPLIEVRHDPHPFP